MILQNLYISGISGFVAQNLSKYLQTNFTITGLSQVASTTVLFYDTFTSTMFEYDAIVHFAGNAHNLL